MTVYISVVLHDTSVSTNVTSDVELASELELNFREDDPVESIGSIDGPYYICVFDKRAKG